MNEKLQQLLLELFTVEQLCDLCRAKELHKRLRTTGISPDEDMELESIMEGLDDVLPKS